MEHPRHVRGLTAARAPVGDQPGGQQPPTPASRRLRAALASRRGDVEGLLERCGAEELRISGSVARGDAGDDSDLDLLVDMAADAGDEFLRLSGLSGLSGQLSDLLGVRVDVVAHPLLRAEDSATAIADAVAG